MPPYPTPRDSVTPPPLRTKVGFWLLLGMLSTAFSEVTSGSMPFPFFHPWGIVVATPLYTLHIVVLATVLVRWRRFGWAGLLFAGALFGLYEAYITKVLWNPDWGNTLPKLGEVSWLHVVLLVLWWHPIFAFIVPLGLAETLLTRSRHVLNSFSFRWRDRLRNRSKVMLLVFAIGCGVLSSANALSPPLALLAPLLNGILLSGLIIRWQRKGHGQQYALEELLPGPRGLAIFTGFLVAFYLLTGFFLLPERLPGPAGHGLILACYGLFVYALIRTPACALPGREEEASAPTPTSIFVRFVLLSAIVSLLTKLVLGGLSVLIILVLWAGACTLGLYVYGRVLHGVLVSRVR